MPKLIHISLLIISASDGDAQAYAFLSPSVAFRTVYAETNPLNQISELGIDLILERR